MGLLKSEQGLSQSGEVVAIKKVKLANFKEVRYFEKIDAAQFRFVGSAPWVSSKFRAQPGMQITKAGPAVLIRIRI